MSDGTLHLAPTLSPPDIDLRRRVEELGPIPGPLQAMLRSEKVAEDDAPWMYRSMRRGGARGTSIGMRLRYFISPLSRLA
jgi:hypothetical protein